ncbi:MAG: acyl-CoA dehydrogenase family protein, partial [Deltaproteobacteria bacterium]|nr:acyl-CoA dehydrogenase family protein [Deltaproteobacteria bacterium]MBW2587114.1 acyl-CoA dehydrogenase family protein [Deltaproteobacteria bacterium]
MLNFEITPEQKILVDETRRFTREKIIPIAGEADKTHEFPMDVFNEAWELGLVGPNIPEE